MMVAYNFKSGFVDAIKAGTKRHTIRRFGRRRHARIGDDLQLYYGMRTKHCKKVIDLVCIATFDIQLTIESHSIQIDINGLRLPEEELNTFAFEDGFASKDSFLRFWNVFHDQELFHGKLICWAPCMAMTFVQSHAKDRAQRSVPME